MMYGATLTSRRTNMLHRLVLMILPLIIASFAYANEPGMGGDGMQKHIEKRDAAIKELNIDQSKKDALIAIFQKYDKQRESIMEEQKSAHKELRKLTEAKQADEKAIQAQLDKIEANMDKLHDLMKAQTKEIKALLKPSEQAALLQSMWKGMGGQHKGGKGGPGMMEKGEKGGPMGK